jgi:hypothetical protein
MSRRFLIPLTILMLPILITACGGESPTPTEQATVTETVTQPPATATEAPVTPTEESPEAETVSGPFGSECVLASSVPEPPAEFVERFGPKEDDWSIGPEDAAVTIIEYGDFQ